MLGTSVSLKDFQPAKPMEARPYQLELLEYLIQNNGIIYLPTGAGKTYVAILALKRFSKDMDRSITQGGKRGIFMCNTVELARQQALEIRKHTNLKVGLYIGERDVDNWAPKKWKEEIEENQVLVGTSQVFLDIIAANYIKITDLSIVIIDECHHGTKKHPMHEFMRMFQYADVRQLPRVVGLTGVLIKGSSIKNVMESLRNLEVTYRGRIVTVSSKEEFVNVLVHSTNPEERLLCYPPNSFTSTIDGVINEMINECTKLVDDFDVGILPIKLTKGLADKMDPTRKKFIKNLLKDFLFHLSEYGLYCSLFVLETAIIELQLKLRQSETVALRRLYRTVSTTLEEILNLLFAKLGECLDEEKLKESDYHKIEVIMNFSTSKVVSLLKFIKTSFECKERRDISCLIFVERRLTAKAICCVIQKFINMTPTLKNVIRPNFMVGRNASLVNKVESILDRHWNKQVMDDFRSGACNMIICSSVLEEGIDVQACNFVIAFDPLKTFNSYIQTKGRARTKSSTYAIVAAKIDEMKVVSQIKEYKNAHAAIQEFLIGRVLDNAEPSENELAVEFADRIKPLRTPSGACLLASGALTLLHRYCQLLPWDYFGCVLPTFVKLPPSPNKSGIVVTVKMPLQSRVKEEIRSEYMENARMSKISAAFNACKRLYEEGELNDKLLPISKKECVAQIASVLFKHWEKYKDNVVGKEGKAKRRMYDKKCPDELYRSMPVLGEICYAYEIHFSSDFEMDENNAHIVNTFKSNSNYAILLRKRLPALAEMPLFMTQGSLRVKIKEKPIEVIITTPAYLMQLKKYHAMIMREILNCWRSYYVLDSRNKQHSYLIVPITHDTIDWSIVQRFECLQPLRAPTINERQDRVYKPEDWLGKVVGKWYTADTRDRFLVTKILYDQTPLTKFTESNLVNHTYADFFETRYGNAVERVVNRQQFLIEVKALTSRRNFFNNAKPSKAKSKRATQKVVLIPELCHNFQYPGDLWLKALFLPSILHRLHFMLHAEHLRRKINAFLGFDKKFSNYKPKPLIIDQSLRRAVDFDGNAANPEEQMEITLPPVAPVESQEIAFQTSDLSLAAEPWMEFMEPINLARQSSSIYPLELQYYCKFAEGFEQKLIFKQQYVEDYTNSQLKMPPAYDKELSAAVNNLTIGMEKFAITDSPLEEKRRIHILKRSMEQQNGIMCAEQYEFMAALTTAGANDVFDMERFELLGDSFLKFSMSLYLVNKYPKWHEGFLTEVKSKLVSNRNLLYCLLETDIPSRICSELFEMEKWLPPLVSLPENLLDALENEPNMRALASRRDLYNIELCEPEILSGRCSQDHFSQFKNCCKGREQLLSDGLESELDNELNFCTYKSVIPDKVIADTLEALLGVCVKNYGIHNAFRMLEFFGLCPTQPGDKPLKNLLDLNFGGARLRADISTREVDSFLINHTYLEQNLGYKFRDRAYLLQALTHPSYPTNRLTGCYQELEFIGDAILDFLVSCYIFERYESKTPGMLTDMRSALVNNVTLGCICVRHRFHLFLLSENAVLAESIKKFADFQEIQKHRLTDQVRILLEEGDCANSIGSKFGNVNIATSVEVPKVLGDIVEALIAAVYLDSRCLVTTWNVVYHLLEWEFIEFNHKVPIDPVRQLHEHPSAKAVFSDPIVDNETTLVKCIFSCLNKSITVHGFGSNKTQAKKSAAKHALHILARSLKK